MSSGSAILCQPVRAATAAFAGTTIEWYDFFIYSTASALVFPQLFFPNSDPNVVAADFALPLSESVSSRGRSEASSSVIWATGSAEKKRSLRRSC